MKIKRKQELDVRIEKVAFGGQGIARINDFVLFVDGGIPGDRLRVRVRKVKKNYAEAYPLELLEPSDLRIDPPCQHFGYCGGCKWQNVPYETQLQFKAEQVKEALEHIGGIPEPRVLAPIPSPKIFGYRNKMEFSFSGNRWLTPEELKNPEIKKDFALGFHVPRYFDRILNIDYCWLQSEKLNQVLAFSRRFFKESGIPVYHLRTHEGVLRFLVLRESAHFGEIMVNVVTAEPIGETMQQFARELQAQVPEVVSVFNGVNARSGQTAFADTLHLIAGREYIRERLENLEFRISPNSFFQTNTLQAENLYRQVVTMAGLTGTETVWDLYAGTGTIALFLAQQAGKVVGFELIDSAVQDARENARRNGIDNVAFVEGDLRHTIRQYQGQPDVIICDPPRAGMHPDVVRGILKARPPRIVYVSCNPATMARDLVLLKDHYDLQTVQPVDMFPHTYHIESVALLVRKSP